MVILRKHTITYIYITLITLVSIKSQSEENEEKSPIDKMIAVYQNTPKSVMTLIVLFTILIIGLFLYLLNLRRRSKTIILDQKKVLLIGRKSKTPKDEITYWDLRRKMYPTPSKYTSIDSKAGCKMSLNDDFYDGLSKQ